MRSLCRALVWLGGVAAASALAHDGVPVADDTWLIPGVFVPGRQPDGNSILLRGPDGLVVVDSGRHAAHARRILDASDAIGLPIVAVVNTHWHLDHVSGNPRLRAAYPSLQVFSSDAIDTALTGFLAASRRQLEQLLSDPGHESSRQDWRDELARIDAGPTLRPDVVVSGGQTLELAGRRLELHLETDAVSGGDIWLFDPATQVLIAGDLVTLPAPFLDTACPARWRAALAGLGAARFRTLIPGHGAAMDRHGFDIWRNAFERLLDCAAGSDPGARCVEGWVQDAAPLLADTPQAQTRALLDYYVHQRLRGDAATRDCPAS